MALNFKTQKSLNFFSTEKKALEKVGIQPSSDRSGLKVGRQPPEVFTGG